MAHAVGDFLAATLNALVVMHHADTTAYTVPGAGRSINRYAVCASL